MHFGNRGGLYRNGESDVTQVTCELVDAIEGVLSAVDVFLVAPNRTAKDNLVDSFVAVDDIAARADARLGVADSLAGGGWMGTGGSNVVGADMVANQYPLTESVPTQVLAAQALVVRLAKVAAQDPDSANLAALSEARAALEIAGR
jgi:hypothetical protein